MPKRRFDGCGGGGGGRGRTAKPPRRHLYLVLDDWSIGYSIRKIDLSSDFDSEDSDQLTAAHGPISSNGKRRLPSAVFRFQAQRGLPMYFADAFDSKIMAMHPITPGINGMLPWVPERLVPVFDVRMRSVIFGPRQIPDLDDPIYIPVGGRLFALSTGSFQLLYPPPGDNDESGSEEEEGWVWSWRQPPFKRKHVTAYTIHPDGRTIFISIKKRRSATTFTFDTAESALRDDCTWKQHGNWMLPFSGRAYFDSVLDAWVGLSRDSGTLGQLCSCDVVSTSPIPTLRSTICKELFVENPVMRRVGATLLYMGNRSKFCLVGCICIKDDSVDEIKDGYVGEMTDGSVGGANEDSVHEMNDDPVGELNEDYEMNDDSGMNDSKLEEQHVSPHSGYFLRLKTFFLMYDKNGDLKTGKHIQVRCYDVPITVSESIRKHPVAFWM
ncbi:unnamed protein product [Urochloa decumbens]|uniref:DUF1618 domain-containing protein n=1 Tax=Urochloa decumbens TaxID=240449 RepID=A0ABC8XHV6_9POAL